MSRADQLAAVAAEEATREELRERAARETIEVVELTQAEFDELPEYSCSLPTGTTIGKEWKRGEPYRAPRERWYRGMYVESEREGYVKVKWQRIRVLTARQAQLREGGILVP